MRGIVYQKLGWGWGSAVPTEAELLARAHEMCRNPTEPEVRLWRHLSNSQTRHKFRRQHVIFPYICDFFCPSKALIVEIDGHTHDSTKDARRDEMLKERGYRTLRFANVEVMENIEGVVSRIVETLESLPDRWPRIPHPNPSPEGEGLAKEKPLPFRGGVGGGGRGNNRP